MNKSLSLILFPVLMFGMIGCGPIAWKQGSGAADLQRDETECRAQQPTDDGAAKCLRDRGWTVTQFAVPDTTTTPAMPNVKSSPAREVTNRNTNDNEIVTSAVDSETVDPQATIIVQSWWKAGAQASDFNVDANSCLNTLGVENTPDYTQHRYSQPLVQCLRERGWRAAQNPTYTPAR